MAKKPLKTFTVNRRTWLHAGTAAIRDEDRARAKARHAPIGNYTDKPNSQLFNPGVGMKCCLGFVAQQCGLPVSALRGVGTPADLALTPKEAAKVAVVVEAHTHPLRHNTNTSLASAAMEINDNVRPNKMRESRLATLFKKNGYRMRFIGRYPAGPVRYRKGSVDRG